MTDSRPRLNKNSATYRIQLWDACANPTTGFVHCNLCGNRVLPGEAWAESHIGIPAAFDGNVVGIAHKCCNEIDNNKFVTPFVAKTKRMRRKHIGADRPGLGKHKLPGSRSDPFKIMIGGGTKPRLGRGGEHRQMMARRQIGGGE